MTEIGSATHADRFWAKVQRGDGCWEWQATISGGYGLFHLAKTHCPQGHPYSGENLYVPPSGGPERHCKECRRENVRRWRARRRGAA